METTEKKVVIRHICKNCDYWKRKSHQNGRCMLDEVSPKRTERSWSCKSWRSLCVVQS